MVRLFTSTEIKGSQFYSVLGSVILALCSSVVTAVPTPQHIALSRKYAPQWRFHASEVYWPSTVEYFLSGVKEVDAKGTTVIGTVTTSNVDSAVNHGSGLYLTMDVKAGKTGFLHGQNPAFTVTAAYTFIVPKDNKVIDIFYWLFTPFNEGKKVPILREIGDHVGDWERMVVHTVNGIATQVDYHTHSDKGSGTIPWVHVIKFDNNQRPVGYVAKGSHGFWATAGAFTYVNAVVFKLQDLTSDGGVSWDIRDSLVNFAYPDTFSGSHNWLNYKGYWGNIGQTTCWWYKIHKECEIVTGPDGPYQPNVLGSARDAPLVTHPSKHVMSGPLSQTLGTVSTEATSSYTFYLDASASRLASDPEYSLLAVQQTCTSNPKPAKDGNQIKPTTSTTFAFTELTGVNRFTITPNACERHFSVTSYRVGVCTNATLADCSWAASRTLRAYSHDPSDNGIKSATAITVSDLDNWRW